ncbi:MAG: pyridoxine 5'-phosphate synthase, partial [Candidatus Omnitrophica bacterium]|nr:pyridoxine 5'-phosphate synthase [Candidatus Omnitrophota bacterium]
MPRLGVNIDHVATLREARKGSVPDPTIAALLCEASGADSIVVHLREDRRHIKDNDVAMLRQVVKTKLNLEMSVASEIVSIACVVKPDQATLVPERRQELTTEGGLDVVGQLQRIKQAKNRLQRQGIEVSLFIDPEKKQIDAAKKIGVAMIELHTGRFADAKNTREQTMYYKQIQTSVAYGIKQGLVVNAGHGLDYANVAMIAKIPGVE